MRRIDKIKSIDDLIKRSIELEKWSVESVRDVANGMLSDYENMSDESYEAGLSSILQALKYVRDQSIQGSAPVNSFGDQ